jgi:hypothetical protein
MSRHVVAPIKTEHNPHIKHPTIMYNIARHSKKKEDEKLETTTTDLSNIVLGLSTFVVEEVGNVGTVGKMDAQVVTVSLTSSKTQSEDS